ncbi:MAG: OmpA family protein [Bacteriovoracaceae bacterium]|nr:OmpA family protein [Bacteriovoracaceae bacterium]
MAEDDKKNAGGGGGGGAAEAAPCPKCPQCPPEGLPGWMATFSDMVTLLLTFFVLLLSFAKTETDKYKAAVGSLRKAFGGNTKSFGEVVMPGKSPEDTFTMFDSQEDVKPFPIDFQTAEGILDKHEINRESEENLRSMREILSKYELTDSVDIYETSEGIRVKFKDKIVFEPGTVNIKNMNVEVYQKLIKLVRENDWTIFIEGHAALGEVARGGTDDALTLSSKRAMVVARSLMKRGLKPEKISTVFYGDSRPFKDFTGDINSAESSRVEFIIRKTDLGTEGHRVDSK